MRIKNLLTPLHPKISEMSFMKELVAGKFGRDEILKSEVVELYRALDTREKIQNIYKEKLNEALKKKIISHDDLALMNEVIDDEGETAEHIDHLDMRFKLFKDTKIKRGKFPIFNEDLQKINDKWVSICQNSNIFEIMSCHCAIEGWYPSVSKLFEKEYRKRGFSTEDLEIFIAHQDADVDHSEAQYNILEKNFEKIDQTKIKDAVNQTFETSKAYENMKLKLANSDKPLISFFK